jgi:hypothetical protein
VFVSVASYGLVKNDHSNEPPAIPTIVRRPLTAIDSIATLTVPAAPTKSKAASTPLPPVISRMRAT